MKYLWRVKVLYFALFFSCSLSQAQSPDRDYRISDERLDQIMERLSGKGNELPKEVRLLSDAWHANDRGKVRKIADIYIARPISEFDNPYYGGRLKADAHYYKYKLIQIDGGSPVVAHKELVEAVQNGHLPAAEEFVEGVLTRNVQLDRLARDPYAAKVPEILRMGAALGGAFSSAALAMTDLGGAIQVEEREYWMLMTIMRDHAKSRDEKRVLLEKVIAEVGERKIMTILAKYSLVGAPFSDVGEIPGRGIYETLFADSDLRGQFGAANGTLTDTVAMPPESVSIRDQFDFYSRVVPDIGFGDVYLLYPSGNAPPSSRAIKMNKPDIIAGLQPGDRMFLTCGGLAHVAIFARRDIKTSNLMFIDPLFQYWQPSHNSCVSSFKLKQENYQRFLSVVPAADVKEMLVGVLTIRRSK